MTNSAIQITVLSHRLCRSLAPWHGISRFGWREPLGMEGSCKCIFKDLQATDIE
jgi:hypothetical protein